MKVAMRVGGTSLGLSCTCQGRFSPMHGLLGLISQLGHGCFYGLVYGKISYLLILLWVNCLVVDKHGELNNFDDMKLIANWKYVDSVTLLKW